MAVTAPNEESPNRLYRLALNFVYSIESFPILLVIRDKICQKWDEICLKWDEICVGRNLSKIGRNLLKMGRNLFGTKSVKIRRGTKSVWDEICHIPSRVINDNKVGWITPNVSYNKVLIIKTVKVKFAVMKLLGTLAFCSEVVQECTFKNLKALN